MSHLAILCAIVEQHPLASIQKKRFRDRISVEARRRRDRLIPRPALQESHSSPFMTLFLSANDQALITLTGFDRNAFSYILQKYGPLYNLYTP